MFSVNVFFETWYVCVCINMFFVYGIYIYIHIYTHFLWLLLYTYTCIRLSRWFLWKLGAEVDIRVVVR